ncbi:MULTISPECIES: hypothetical protein [Hyphomicrobiales]|jgi:hypothetical protein|uniref:Uncharacterized protein n=1 Tax=Bosea massiliensis TaxID=151419 RepID=A0ABW0NYR8_9HYPH|nr:MULTISPECIES: hypothetical protein [Hyphomicrobiales]
MTTRKRKASAACDETLPGAEDLSRYARTYAQLGDHAERHFLLWQLSSAHAMLLEQDGDRIHAEFGGLNGRQLAEGARAQARFFAFMLAEAPAQRDEHLERKITVYEAMIFQEDEMARSHTAVMVEAAMQVDARKLGINLTKVAIEPGSMSRH